MSIETETTNAAAAHLAEYATVPTRTTLFLRTFLPWQIIRFLVLNTKILLMTIRNERHK